MQRAESELRKALPEALGGRLTHRTVSCRLLTDQDLAALHALRPSGRGDGPSSPRRGEPSSPHVIRVGIWRAHELIAAAACVGVGPGDAAPFEHVLFATAYVTPRYRRRGLTRLMHDTRLREAAARGARQALAWVHEDNGASRAGLLAVGFERVPAELAPAWLRGPGPKHALYRCDVARYVAHSSGRAAAA